MFINVYLTTLLLAALASLIKEGRDLFRHQRPPLLAWNITFAQFLQIFALAVVCYFFSSLIAAEATKDWAENQALEPWRLTLVGYAAHLSILILLAFLFNTKVRDAVELKLTDTPLQLIPQRMPIHRAMLAGLTLFLAALPILGVVSMVWGQVLELLNDFGFNIPLDRQAQIEMFANVENPYATAALIFLAVVIAPISEELFFRGFIYRYLKGQAPRLLAMIISAAFFALIHFNWMAMAPLFLLGIVLCWAYEKNENILASIFLHGIFNANTILIIFLAPDLEALS
ncbi:CPBP family intramembrane glutamic endopeptidase [Cerasicoccus maritimus]|uniref:CPBP family intramembrane glutamic endopeptidase n=1 Tax=Cerasicoccus maritimus TaxID=490089 RepID=UPI002852C8EB|nr:CPBP family intramembrane glutamic endopeptidase [Cerasicoccus maritimus]